MTRAGVVSNYRKIGVYSYIFKKLENVVLRLERAQRTQRMRRA